MGMLLPDLDCIALPLEAAGHNGAKRLNTAAVLGRWHSTGTYMCKREERASNSCFKRSQNGRQSCFQASWRTSSSLCLPLRYRKTRLTAVDFGQRTAPAPQSPSTLRCVSPQTMSCSRDQPGSSLRAHSITSTCKLISHLGHLLDCGCSIQLVVDCRSDGLPQQARTALKLKLPTCSHETSRCKALFSSSCAQCAATVTSRCATNHAPHAD